MSLPILLALMHPPTAISAAGDVVQAVQTIDGIAETAGTINAAADIFQVPQTLQGFAAVGSTIGTGSQQTRTIRTWGRINQVDGIGGQWVEVTTDANGFDDNVYITTLAQTLKLNLGESPFFANYGIPAQQSVITQVFPDFYAAQTQQQFAPYFASLSIVRRPQSYPPIYDVTAICHSGAILKTEVAL